MVDGVVIDKHRFIGTELWLDPKGQYLFESIFLHGPIDSYPG